MSLKFGTSGVRGPVTEMTDLECALFTRAFIEYVQEETQEKRIYLAGDLRKSTPRIMRAVAYAIEQAGMQLVYAGHVPTPTVMYAAMREACASIMVTGSHIPDDRNGIKFNLPWGEVLKQDETHISARYRALKELSAQDPAFTEDGSLRDSEVPRLGTPLESVTSDYIRRYLSWFPEGALAGQTIVLYEHSAVGRELLGELLEQLGATVVRVGHSDQFVPVDTEAVDEPDRLAAWVLEHQADALVTADGDTDRPLVIDERGNIVRGDILGIVVAAALGADAVVAPISCNTALEKCGVFETTVRTRIGSPYVVAGMQEALEEGFDTVVGYEANGGFLLASSIARHDGELLLPLPTRDAVLPILTILATAVRHGRTVSELVSELPSRYTISGLLRQVPSERGATFVKSLEAEGEALASRLFRDVGRVESIDFTDGARMTLADGRILHLRPSGNAPEFRIYTEAETEADAQDLNDRAARLVRQALEQDEPGPSEQDERLVNIAKMNDAPAQGLGMDIVIVSTTSKADEAYWQERLEATHGQITNREAHIIAVHEDWPDGAGNGLGTLYALRLAQEKGERLHGIDLLGELKRGAAIAMYHTAGKGTRLAPLPAVEANNKPAVKLPGLVKVQGALAPITVLESVIKQTGIYAQGRRGRVSVFWGDQVFVPSVKCAYTPRHHIDIIGKLGPMPDAAAWKERKLETYGLLAVDEHGDGYQVEKVTYESLQELVRNGSLGVAGGIGVSIGSFSMSTACTLALLEEFSPELDSRAMKMDTDPHFWMPMTLDAATYRAIREGREEAGFDLDAHHARMQRLARQLRDTDDNLQLFGVVDVGAESYWWDYGQLQLYVSNILLMCEESVEGEAVRRFFRAENRHLDSQLGTGVEVDHDSCILGSSVESGQIEQSVLIDCHLAHAQLRHCVLIDVEAPQVAGVDGLLYHVTSSGEVTVLEHGVRADVDVDSELATMQTDLSRHGGDDWHAQLPGNPYSYDDLYNLVKNQPRKGTT